MAGSDSTRATQACRADPRVSAFAACLRRVDRGASRMMDIQRQRVLELCNEFRLGGVNAPYTALAEKSGREAQLIHRLPRGTPDREALVLRPTHRDREVTCRGSMYLIKQKTWSGG